MPKTVGKYEILNTLGTGAMGVVYRALDPVIDRVVAIKVLSPSLVENPRQRERFFQEARTAGKLRHPNIVVIYDCGEDQGVPYIVMEYLEGEDLRDLIGTGAGWSLERKLDFIGQVCRGLSHAHQKSVVHRDVKPGNMRVLPDGSAKIMDFGIARLSDSTQTQTGAILGTVAYMAPEQCQSAQVTAASDIWSVGVVLFELLTGHRPFEADNNVAVIRKIVTDDPPPLSRYFPDCPPELEAIVSRALAKEPARRYQRADDLLADIERLLLKIRLNGAVEGPPTEAGRAAGTPPPAATLDSISITGEVRRTAACIEAGNYEEAERLIERLSGTDVDLVILSSLRATLERSRTQASAPEAHSTSVLGQPAEDVQIPGAPAMGPSVEPGQIPGPLRQPPPAPDKIVRRRVAETELELPKPRVVAPAREEPPRESAALTEIRPALPAVPRPGLPSGTRLGVFTAGRRRWFALVAGALALAIIGVFLYRALPRAGEESRPRTQEGRTETVAPAEVTQAVSLNVLPWAEILEVTEKGSGRTLPELKGRVTPVYLYLPPGEYVFRVRNRAITRELTFSASVTSGPPLQLTRSFPEFDPKAAVREFGIQ